MKINLTVSGYYKYKSINSQILKNNLKIFLNVKIKNIISFNQIYNIIKQLMPAFNYIMSVMYDAPKRMRLHFYYTLQQRKMRLSFFSEFQPIEVRKKEYIYIFFTYMYICIFLYFFVIYHSYFFLLYNNIIIIIKIYLLLLNMYMNMCNS